MGQAVAMANLGSMFGAGDAGTFLGLPSATPTTSHGADIVVIGAPCATPYSSVGPYCKEAPAAIRAASAAYSGIRHHHNFDLGGPMLVEGTTAVDLGDVPWDDTAHEANRAAIRHACESVLAAGAVPVVLGGDDSIPIPVPAGLHRSGSAHDRADRRPHRLARRGAGRAVGLVVDHAPAPRR